MSIDRPAHRPDALTSASPSLSHETVQATVISSAALLNGHRQVMIQHGEKIYRLCQTRNDKLILMR